MGQDHWFVLGFGMPNLAFSLEDEARLHYSRVLWRNPLLRQRLLYVWEHPEHPHRERFEENRALIEGFLKCSDPESYANQAEGGKKWSLRTLTREIPCVIWSLWDESKVKLVSTSAG